MDSGKEYVSRKKKLQAELRAIGSTPVASLTTPQSWAAIAANLCSVLSRFDLGEKVDDVVAGFLSHLESKPVSQEDTVAKFHKVMCLLYSVADEFRDYSS
jgi:hypothetical protein